MSEKYVAGLPAGTGLFTTKPVGKAVGLSISRGIAQSVGGELRYDPDSEHTRFEVVLPWERAA